MAQKIAKTGITREKGYLYYVDKDGDVAMAKMARGGKKGGGAKKIAKTGVRRESGFLYYIDKDGDAPLPRGVAIATIVSSCLFMAVLCHSELVSESLTNVDLMRS